MRNQAVKISFICLMASFIIFSLTGNSLAIVYEEYEVKSGDTLWAISQQNGVSVTQIMQINGLKDSLIVTGQTLKIPKNAKSANVANDKNHDRSAENRQAYTVKNGDTLWKIAQKFGTSTRELQSQNQLHSSIIHPGQRLMIPAQKKGGVTTATVGLPTGKPIVSYTENDYYWLAKIIEAEAEDEPYSGKVAVGSVIMNRIKDDWFPNSITEVIFQKYNGTYQFSPVGNGRIYRVTPTTETYRAAEAALRGEDPTNGALYFYNPKIAKDQWIFSRKVVAVIGQHRFAY